MQVVGYVRVSTDEQAVSGAGLEAQRRAIRAECARRGWDLQNLLEDRGASAKGIQRPGLAQALIAVESSGAEAIVVAKVDRLSRSLTDFAALMERSRRKGWAIVALDLGVDTTTPSGEMLAHVLAVFAQFESRLIGQRTRDALAVRRTEGVRLGRPTVLSPQTGRRIRSMSRKGGTLSEIARVLTAEGVPTAHGGRRWYPSTVRAIVRKDHIGSSRTDALQPASRPVRRSLLLRDE